MTGGSTGRRLGRAVRQGAQELFGLVVEDGFVAVGALVAIAVCGVLTRDGMLGATLAAGLTLFALLAASLLGSLRREVRRRSPRPDAPP